MAAAMASRVGSSDQPAPLWFSHELTTPSRNLRLFGNWLALEAVIVSEGSWDAVAFCGDVVDYCPYPARCLSWVAEHAQYRVRGNHDNAVGFFADCRCTGAFRACSSISRSWHQALLNESDRKFLRGLPTLHWFEWQGRHFRMAHATPQGDMFEYLAMDQWEERTKGLEEDFVLLGHTHAQGMRSFGKLRLVNPGSVGLARDRGGRPAMPSLMARRCC